MTSKGFFPPFLPQIDNERAAAQTLAFGSLKTEAGSRTNQILKSDSNHFRELLQMVTFFKPETQLCFSFSNLWLQQIYASYSFQGFYSIFDLSLSQAFLEGRKATPICSIIP